MSGIPSRLYKYTTIERVSDLPGGLVRFTPPKSLNDPNDMEMRFARAMPEDELQKMIENVVREQRTEAIMSEAATKKVPPRVAQTKWFKERVSHAAKLMKLKSPTLLRHHFGELEKLLPTFSVGAMSAFGVYCLSEVPTSMPMWAHYAENHRGVVLEINCESEFFVPIGRDMLSGIRRVEYGDLVTSEYLTRLNINEILLKKATEWAYEREWRMFRKLADAEKIVKTNAEDVHLFRLPEGSFTRVILGMAVSEAKEQEIREMIAQKFAAALRPSLQRAVRDPATGALTFVNA